MKYAIARLKVTNSLSRSYYNRKNGFVLDQRRNKFSLSYRLCGQVFDPNRPTLKHRCGKSICPDCSKRWANKLAKRFLCQTDSRDNADYKMITIMISLHADSSGCFDGFKTFRNRVHKTIGKAREVKKRDLTISTKWRNFTMFGSAEIDVFYKSDFEELGLQKQESLLRDLKYDKNDFDSDQVYVLHYHAVMYVGDFNEDNIIKRFKKYAASVHIQDLDKSKSLENNVYDIIGYGSKVSFDRTLNGNRKLAWKQDEIDDFVGDAIYRSGRKSYKFGITRKL